MARVNFSKESSGPARARVPMVKSFKFRLLYEGMI